VASTDLGETLSPTDPSLEQAVQQIGREYLDRARHNKAGMLSGAFWSDKLMDWSMKDEAFKVQFFRFVDAFPMLHTPDAVYEHLSDYLSQPGVTPPPGFALGMKAGGIAKGLFAKTVSGQITSMAEKFIAGTDAASALAQLKNLWSRGMAFSVDLLGEACVSDEEAASYQKKYLDLIDNLPANVKQWPANPALDSDHLGAIPRTNVSIKISSLFARTDPIDTEGSIRGLMEVLKPILENARENNVLINFDMEQELPLVIADRAALRRPLVLGKLRAAGDTDRMHASHRPRSPVHRAVPRAITFAGRALNEMASLRARATAEA
jgi:RHH-type proline utilization regulon transcriptional repressor/proline dehydrogenase/delta 1-pyrroline-5-carboxylate dehydrogenase